MWSIYSIHSWGNLPSRIFAYKFAKSLITIFLEEFHYFILLHKCLIALIDGTHAVLLLFFKAGDKCFFGHKSKPLFQWSFKGGSTVVFKGVKREFWFIQTTPATGSLLCRIQKMQVWFLRNNWSINMFCHDLIIIFWQYLCDIQFFCCLWKLLTCFS